MSHEYNDPDGPLARRRADAALVDGLTELERYLIDPDPNPIIPVEQGQGEYVPAYVDKTPILPDPGVSPEPNPLQKGIDLLYVFADPNQDWREGDFPKELTVDTALGLFTYDDVVGSGHVGETENPHAVAYAQELVDMYKETGGRQLADLTNRMTTAAITTLERIGIEPSPYASSPTWALWDMAKQRYMAHQPEERRDSSYETRQLDNGHSVVPNVGDAIGHDQLAVAKRMDIVDRHIGWEVVRSHYVAGTIGVDEASSYHAKIAEKIVHGDHNDRPIALLDGSTVMSLRSYELSRIGDMARNAALRGRALGGRYRGEELESWYAVMAWGVDDQQAPPEILSNPDFLDLARPVVDELLIVGMPDGSDPFRAIDEKATRQVNARGVEFIPSKTIKAAIEEIMNARETS